mmetsp:Transcript_118840/g.379156  ORF Transcript_118840/g.379156 Transcript_118840/m.379156 type:complete len:284 (-) Transcript_118840:8-859(-)
MLGQHDQDGRVWTVLDRQELLVDRLDLGPHFDAIVRRQQLPIRKHVEPELLQDRRICILAPEALARCDSDPEVERSWLCRSRSVHFRLEAPARHRRSHFLKLGHRVRHGHPRLILQRLRRVAEEVRARVALAVPPRRVVPQAERRIRPIGLPERLQHFVGDFLRALAWVVWIQLTCLQAADGQDLRQLRCIQTRRLILLLPVLPQPLPQLPPRRGAVDERTAQAMALLGGTCGDNRSRARGQKKQRDEAPLRRPDHHLMARGGCFVARLRLHGRAPCAATELK